VSILVDHQIRRMCHPKSPDSFKPMLAPFSEGKQDGVISYGLTSAGYDLRLGRQVFVFKNSFNELMDPKRLKQDEAYLNRVFDVRKDMADGTMVVLPAHSYLLAYSLEYIWLPGNIKGTCVGKSTLARCGLIVNTTPLEPGWHGHLTIEIGNISPCPVPIYVGEGIAQLEFHVLGGIPEIDYAKKGGKYQGQGAEPVPGTVKMSQKDWLTIDDNDHHDAKEN
jgi:dCTP deaminase